MLNPEKKPTPKAIAAVIVQQRLQITDEELSAKMEEIKGRKPTDAQLRDVREQVASITATFRVRMKNLTSKYEE